MAKKTTNDLGEKVDPNNEADFELAIDAKAIFNFQPTLGRDVTIPRFLIAQPTSRFPGIKDNVGTWYNTVTGEYFDVIECLILQVHQPRGMFQEPYEPGAPMLCRSRDSINPLPEYIDRELEGVIIPELCEHCPHSQWVEPEQEGQRRLPPRCSEMYLYFGVDVSTSLPFSLRLKGTALSMARGLNTLIEKNLAGQTYEFSLVEEQGEYRYYVPVLSPGRSTSDLDVATRKRVLHIFQALQGQPLLERENGALNE
jgi:hypothetical protein